MIKDFFIKLFCSETERTKELENKLQSLTEDFKMMENNFVEKKEELSNTKKLLDEYRIVISSKDNEIKNLKTKLEHENIVVEKPSFLTGKMLYRPKRRFVSKTKDFVFTFKKPQHTFDKSPFLNELLENSGLKGCTKNITNAAKIKKLIEKIDYDYERDNSDNWRPVTDTLLSGFGDCEDRAQVLVSAYGICGWTADEVFNCCGLYNNEFGHSYGGLKVDGKWFIFEGTSKTNLMAWKNHPEYRANYGICNWKFDGMIVYDGKVCDRILDDDEL